MVGGVGVGVGLEGCVEGVEGVEWEEIEVGWGEEGLVLWEWEVDEIWREGEGRGWDWLGELFGFDLVVSDCGWRYFEDLYILVWIFWMFF